MKNVYNIPLIERAHEFSGNTAIIDKHGEYTYGEILDSAKNVAACLLNGKDDIREVRIVFMVPSSFEYVAVQWGIWLAGGIAVPVSIKYPLPEIDYILNDTAAKYIIVHPDLIEKTHVLLNTHDIRLITTTEAMLTRKAKLPVVEKDRRAMIVYTSGTTGKPKGVVTTHEIISSQITTLIDSWEWTSKDYILLTLPLHHVHGIVNILSCALWAGAICEMMEEFNAQKVWESLLNNDVNLFMAVPTVYVKLINVWENSDPAKRVEMSNACTRIRLMVSGSAALPANVYKKWKMISGHSMLERYGMTEVGMAISNPLHGERKPGYIGKPFAGVRARIVDERGEVIKEEGIAGEICIRSKNVFLEYWGKPEDTKKSFRDDWFLTGDIAVREDGYYRILGRNSVDIIKTGGYKVSALEIEEILREHPSIAECAVVGVSDPEWGEKICTAVILENKRKLSLQELREWGKERLSLYKVPKEILIVDSLPRNIMGKVTKPDVKKLFR